MITETQIILGSPVRLQTDFNTAVERVTAALKTEGFGVLTEIDVKETLKKKIDVDFRQYKILGACNPPLSHRALTAAPEVGLLLPCNVTVSEADDGSVEVAFVNPLTLLSIVAHPEVKPAAEEAHKRLMRVAASLSV